MSFLGWIALITSISGHALVTHSKIHGWALRGIAGAFWITYAFEVNSGPYIASSIVYAGLDLYGLYRTWKVVRS